MNLAFENKFNLQGTCSWEDRWCWPGKCINNLASTCNCTDGFKTVKNSLTARCQRKSVSG
jgi:hypothetical protein